MGPIFAVGNLGEHWHSEDVPSWASEIAERPLSSAFPHRPAVPPKTAAASADTPVRPRNELYVARLARHHPRNEENAHGNDDEAAGNQGPAG